ncbi:Hypothetical predicted protein, partial [Olea europaea subsp. europaea]
VVALPVCSGWMRLGGVHCRCVVGFDFGGFWFVCFASGNGVGFGGKVAVVIVEPILGYNDGGEVAVVWCK